MVVVEQDLEASLAALCARVGDPRAGLYGPGSLSWDINREAVVMLGGGAAALLQLAHPYVAHAVDQHSQTRTDPLGRFTRTFTHVFAMVFGDLETAVGSARRVHAVHRSIRGAITEDVGRFARGHRYLANDPEALLWVHATLVDTALVVYEQLVQPLTPIEREAYYRETKLFAMLFGIPDAALPENWSEFQAYYQRTIASDTIAVSEPCRTMRRFLFAPPTPAHRPFVRWFEAYTAGLLPARLREPLGFSWGLLDRQLYRRAIPALRVARRGLPPALRYFPAYREALRRLDGQPPHDRVGRFFEQVALRSLQPRD